MIQAIMATDLNGVYGLDGGLPWAQDDSVAQEDEKRDMENFKKVTRGGIVVMGSGTWEADDMLKPLPGRINIVITTSADRFMEYSNDPHIDEVWHASDLASNCRRAQIRYPGRDLFVLGGKAILMQFMNEGLIDRFHLTVFNAEVRGDRSLDLEQVFDLMSVDKKTTTSYGTKFYELVKRG
jgi:dihydrofolate reductase